MLTTSVVDFKPGADDAVKAALAEFTEIELYGTGNNQALIIFDTADQKQVEKICEKLYAHDEIITISHHSFYFEDDDIPPMEELFKQK